MKYIEENKEYLCVATRSSELIEETVQDRIDAELKVDACPRGAVFRRTCSPN